MPAVRFAYSQTAVIAVLLVCGGLSAGAPLTLLLVSLVLVACAVRLPTIFAAALGVVAWAYFTGFVTNEYGELTFATPDLARLALLVVLAATAHWTR